MYSAKCSYCVLKLGNTPRLTYEKSAKTNKVGLVPRGWKRTRKQILSPKRWAVFLILGFFKYIGIVAVCALAAALASAQITFSRDWSGGKRSAPQASLDCSQFTRLCRHFVRELKQALTSEMAAKHHKEDIDKAIYDDE